MSTQLFLGYKPPQHKTIHVFFLQFKLLSSSDVLINIQHNEVLEKIKTQTENRTVKQKIDVNYCFNYDYYMASNSKYTFSMTQKLQMCFESF